MQDGIVQLACQPQRPELRALLLLSYSGLTKVSGYGALSLVTEDLKDRATEERRTRCARNKSGAIPQSQTDVYLLGLTLYECLVGGVPFSDADAFRAAMLHGEVPALRLDNLPSSLVPVLRRATAKNPASVNFCWPIGSKPEPAPD